ncbi:MAG: hypothetical protein N3F08_06850 [Crenarchaeota archaeon]|nr:hypothetical protein [Thermoproteota archaeon]
MSSPVSNPYRYGSKSRSLWPHTGGEGVSNPYRYGSKSGGVATKGLD